MSDEVLPREWVLRLNIFEAGVLSVLIHESKHSNGALKEVYKQLQDFRRQIEEAAGVQKELLPNGLLKLTSADGFTIIRPPYDGENDLIFREGEGK